MRGYYYFSLWSPIAVAKIYFFRVVLTWLACEQAPSEQARSEKNSASEERDSASDASGTRGSL